MRGNTSNIPAAGIRNGSARGIWKRLAGRLTRSALISERTARLTLYVFMISLSFVFVFPFLYMLVTSLKSNEDLYDFTVNWVPTVLKVENYIIAFRALGYMAYLQNSLLITIVATVGHILSCSFVGYGFARYQFPLKNVLFFIVIVAFIVPVQTLIVPLYMLFANFKWLNSYLPILVPTFFGLGLKGALFIFIYRQFYLGIPKELENAAKIDGCGFLRTYWLIILPMARPVFLVSIVLSMVWHWNDFFEPSIYAPHEQLSILPARLNVLITLVESPPEDLFKLLSVNGKDNTINNAVVMAGTLMVILPILVSFSFLQRKFMQGIERTGLSGE
ncbi:MAG: carbohydrate ABC transporter permease [Paenibacillaceae bacterium]|nr:carbohydrate ABC transporter permease [Paenibacillaceae bacterium]